MKTTPLSQYEPHTRGEGSPPKTMPTIIYANTTATGCYSPYVTGDEVLDWGTIVGSNDHDAVTEVEFGYVATLPTTAVRYRVYDDYAGWCGTITDVLLDISLTGLPGSPNPGSATGWIGSLDMKPTGSCFFLDEGPFGYSWTMSDDFTGPTFAIGGTGNEDAVDLILVGSTCYTAQNSVPRYSLHTGLMAEDGNDTFPGGCGGGLTLAINGSTCSGNEVSVTVSGATQGNWWAIAVGTTIGASVGGTIGGCPLDVVPVVPISAMGPLPSQPLTFLASVSLVPGMSLGIQVITKDTSSNTWDTANTEIINSL